MLSVAPDKIKNYFLYVSNKCFKEKTEASCCRCGTKRDFNITNVPLTLELIEFIILIVFIFSLLFNGVYNTYSIVFIFSLLFTGNISLSRTKNRSLKRAVYPVVSKGII